MTDLGLRGGTMRPSFLSTGSVLAAPLFALGIVLVAGTVARLVDHLLRDAVGMTIFSVIENIFSLTTACRKEEFFVADTKRGLV